MHKRVRELVEWGERIGFTCGPLDGAGHYPMTHTNGGIYRLAATPSDWRGDLNAKAAMRRIAGVEHDGPNSGKYRKGISKSGRIAHLASEEEVFGTSIGHALRESHRRTCDEIAALQHDPTVGRWRKEAAVRRLVEIENALVEFGHPVPLRTFRYLDRSEP